MTDQAIFKSVRDGLFQPERGLHVVPIRHHSPACAWYLRQMLAAVKPTRVLIEAPADFAPQIPLLLDTDTKPPVALVALVDPKEGQSRLAGYYPFCDHSPEFVALREGQRLGAELQFIDAPSVDKVMASPPGGTEPVTFSDEHHFDSNDYTAALARETGCRDGFELWDHLFEAQIGGQDWRTFFGEVGVYCAGIRKATPAAQITETGDDYREAHMAHAVKKALQAGGPVVVVVGGFHAPALIGDFKSTGQVEKSKGSAQCYLIRYSYRALDALNGYAAGLPQPGYYQHMWDVTEQGMPPWRDIAIGLLSQFTDIQRDAGRPIALPVQVEAVRIAEALARLRGRPGALRYDLIDGVKGAMVKGESQRSDPVIGAFRAFLCGDKLGDVPASAGSPPLVEDVHRLARKHRFDISDSGRRRRKLDVRRKEAHLEASRFCHALALIGSPFTTREIGPDYITGSRTELLFEEWTYAWSPGVDGHLIENAVLGDDLQTACLNHLIRFRQAMKTGGRGRDLPELVELLSRGLLAGLGEALVPFLEALSGDIQSYGTFTSVTSSVRRLMFLQRSTGPMRAPKELDLSGAVKSAYHRLVYLCDTLPNTQEDQVNARLEAIWTVTEILRDCDGAGLDKTLLIEALGRAAERGENPVILGALLAVSVQAGMRSAQELLDAVQGRLIGVSLDLADRIGVLRGVLHTAPMLLWHADGLLSVVDKFLCELSEEDFLELLPHLRLAFTALNPRDTDKLAEELARMHGVNPGQLLKSIGAVTEADLNRALAIEKALLATLKSDGLTDWVIGDAP